MASCLRASLMPTTSGPSLLAGIRPDREESCP
jgi:hypothetical protein